MFSFLIKNSFIKIKIFNFFRFIIKFMSPLLACKLNNLRQKTMGRSIYFSYDKNKKLFCVKDESNIEVYFSEKVRGFDTYSYSIKYRAETLAQSYSLDKIKFNNNDVVIDCGANFGDIFIFFLLKNLKIQYVSFEPSPKEYSCLLLNCKNQSNNNIGLSNRKGNYNFYLKSGSGDSSLIEPAGGFKKIIQVPTTTLDDFVQEKNIKRIKFFKIEAEGAEPEVLEGSKNSLKIIDYIGVDGSRERGKKEESTIEFAKEFLQKNDFDLIKIIETDDFIKGLFKNKKNN